MSNLNRTLQEIERKYGSKVARAFADAVADLRDSVTLRRVVDALDAGDVQSALDMLNIDEAAFSGLRQQLAAAFAESGGAVIAGVRFDPPGETRGVLRWNVGNPEAVRALNEWLGTKITQITEDTRNAARTALSEGYARGQGPRQIALDVVGRVGPNGRRSGGVLGLNGSQERWVSNMREYLRNGDLDKVLRMSKRDRRFDRTIRKMLKEGRTPTEAQINKWTGRYSDKLLKLRGDTIARTETAAAVEQGRFDAFRQGMDAKGYPHQYAIKEWRHGGGGMKPRVQHVAENESEVRGLDTPFRMPDGTLIQYPHAPDTPAKHAINCTCSLLVRIDWVGLRRDGHL
ncbi:MAG: hypothetical protein GY766_20320 [Herbaspirillum sp.]|uniref:hypothetical protein n=1 Tax=Herbaspirillum sp. TaxID=1890675 RepID=UPI00258C50D9|nr:hypothetical protein [Herbaspirillum sp.]MCP3657205.1 hypothetical protein [Herbaspirillum sp.]